MSPLVLELVIECFLSCISRANLQSRNPHMWTLRPKTRGHREGFSLWRPFRFSFGEAGYRLPRDWIACLRCYDGQCWATLTWSATLRNKLIGKSCSLPPLIADLNEMMSFYQITSCSNWLDYFAYDWYFILQLYLGISSAQFSIYRNSSNRGCSSPLTKFPNKNMFRQLNGTGPIILYLQ